MKYLLIADGTYSDQIRTGMALNRLMKDTGVEGELAYYRKMTKDILKNRYDLVICSRPMNPAIVQAFKDLKMPILADMDDDFWSIPSYHPGYKTVGPGNPMAIASFNKCLELADAISTSTDTLKQKFQEQYGDKVYLVENGWDAENINWQKSVIEKDPKKVYVGWTGTITHRKDFTLTLNAIADISVDFDNVVFVIYGDPDIYNMLSAIPEHKKLFIPPTEYQEYPGVLGCFDILMVPLLDNAFNAAKSDIKLVDAGARKIPWIASRSSAYMKWYDGGMFASTTEEWIEHLSDFIRSHSTRKRLGEIGYQKALTRESKAILPEWIAAIEAAKYNCLKP
jgi:glycosyltransferase involved in cell wall biosynthesis